MLKPKKKITKKELKEDKFVLWTLKAKTYLEENYKLVVRVGLALLVIIVLVTMYVQSRRSAEQNALALLGEAEIALETGNRSQAITQLNEVIEKFDGTAPAGKATFLLAKLYWEENDVANSKRLFQKYIDDYGDDLLLMPGALAGLGDCFAYEKNYSEAAKYYERAYKANPESPEAPAFLLSAVLAYKDAGNTEKAKKLAGELIEKFPQSSQKNRAEIILAEIKLIESVS